MGTVVDVSQVGRLNRLVAQGERAVRLRSSGMLRQVLSELDSIYGADSDARVVALREKLATRERDAREAIGRPVPPLFDDDPSVRLSTIDTIRRKLRRTAEGALENAASITRGFEETRLSKDDYAAFQRQVNFALSDLAADEQFRKAAKRERRAAAAVQVREPEVYGKGSPHSWIRDVLVAQDANLAESLLANVRRGDSDLSSEAVQQRLGRHAAEVRHAVQTRNKYGRRIIAQCRERSRGEDEVQNRRRFEEELRALTTGGGATATASSEAAAFVAPAILLDCFASFRSPFASFASQCEQQPLPDYGMNVYIAHLTGGGEVTTQTEGSAVAEKVPTTGLLKSAIVNKAGQVEVTNQFLDRVGPGIGGDELIFKQLAEQVRSEIDSYALSQVLAGAAEVTNSGSFEFSQTSGVGGFVGDIRKAKNKLATTAGTRIMGTHLFAPSQLINYCEAYATSTGGPVFSPELDDNRLPIRSEGDPRGEGYTGYVLSQLAVFTDDNLPEYGTTSNYQVVVARPDTVVVFKSTPIFYLFPQTLAGSLEALIGVRQYTATIPRWPEGVCTITGAAYAASHFA